MKKLIIAALMLSALSVAGQELKKITFAVAPGRSFPYEEEYYVLKDAHKVRQGPYRKTRNHILLEEGHYKNDKKDSTWIKYGGYGDILTKGNYENDKKVGVWQYFTAEGVLEQEYDFTRKELIFFKPEEKPTIYQIISNKDTIYAPLSRPPLIIGGHHGYLEKLANCLNSPVSNIKKNAGGKVFISFVIDENGKTSNYKVIKKGDKDMDHEALRVVKLIDNWLPAVRDGKSVKIVHIVPIIFENACIVHPQ